VANAQHQIRLYRFAETAAPPAGVYLQMKRSVSTVDLSENDIHGADDRRDIPPLCPLAM